MCQFDTVCLAVFLLGFILLGYSVLPGFVCQCPFPCQGIFQLLFLQIVTRVPSGAPIMWRLRCLILSHKSLRLSSFLLLLLYSVLEQWFPPFCVPGYLFIFLPQIFWGINSFYHFLHLCSLVPLCVLSHSVESDSLQPHEL